MISSIPIYISNIVFTTVKGLRLANFRPTFIVRENLLFKVNYYYHISPEHEYNKNIDLKIIELNNTIVKEAIIKYFKSIGDDSLNDYPELFNYTSEQFPESLDNYEVVDMTDLV